MPVIAYSFSAGEFLDEELSENWIDGWYEEDHTSIHPYQWWMLK